MFYISLWIAKLARWLIKTFSLNKRSGFTWSGHIALKINKHLLSSPNIKYSKGLILISGTNGKTTTATLISHMLKSHGLKVVHNRTGANLINGIVSSILVDMNIFGIPKSDVAVFEIDEFALPVILKDITPSVLVLLNLSRDQLDRYGEVDIILERWKEAVSKMSVDTTMVLDMEQEVLKDLARIFGGRVFYFDSEYTFLEKSKLHGHFNAKNINSALLVSNILGLEATVSERSLETFEAVYGRGEVIEHFNKNFHIFLAKNPASFNANLNLIVLEDLPRDTLLLIFNDKIPDGRDVSWIYDISREKLYSACLNKNIYITGTRALDMAIRLHYAGVEVPRNNVSTNIKALVNVVAEASDIKDILVLPNYSAMLELREILTGKKIL